MPKTQATVSGLPDLAKLDISTMADLIDTAKWQIETFGVACCPCINCSISKRAERALRNLGMTVRG